MERFQQLLLSLTVAVCVLGVGCDNNANFKTPTPLTVDLTTTKKNSLIIEPGNPSVAVGKTTQLTAIFNQSGELKRGLPVTWESLNPALAQIDASGTLTALKPGNVQVKAKTLGEEATAFVSIIVAPEETKKTVSTSTPASTSLSSGSSTSKTTPSIASDGSALTPELAKLRAIEIKPQNQVQIEITHKLSRISETEQFVAVGKDAEGQAISNLTFKWTSSDEKVATVNSTGVVTAVASGFTNLIATAGNVQSNTVQIEVQSATVKAQIRFTTE